MKSLNGSTKEQPRWILYPIGSMSAFSLRGKKGLRKNMQPLVSVGKNSYKKQGFGFWIHIGLNLFNCRLARPLSLCNNLMPREAIILWPPVLIDVNTRKLNLASDVINLFAMYLVSINLIESHTGRYIPRQGFLLQGNRKMFASKCPFKVSISYVLLVITTSRHM